MLLLHELHEVVGPREDEFEAAVRDEWLPALGQSDGARLLYYLKRTHGTGPSYHVTTWTAVRDGAAWEDLVHRVEDGDLRALAEKLDGLRHDVTAKMLRPLPWSPLQTIELARVPVEAAEHGLTLFMQDTVWPYEGRLEEYVERSGSHYARFMERGGTLLRIEGSFRTVFGSHRRREVILWQKVVDEKGLLRLLTHEVPARYKEPGTWMHDALEVRDRWESALLRTSAWSPLF